MKKLYAVVSFHHMLQVWSFEGLFDDPQKHSDYVAMRQVKNPGLDFQTTEFEIPAEDTHVEFWVCIDNGTIVGLCDNPSEIPESMAYVQWTALNKGRYEQ